MASHEVHFAGPFSPELVPAGSSELDPSCFLPLHKICYRVADDGSSSPAAGCWLHGLYGHSALWNVALAAVDADAQVFRNHSAVGIGPLRWIKCSGTRLLLHRAIYRTHL
jgi:hypothetical protein